MNADGKKRLANERRLKAVHQWQKNKTQHRVLKTETVKSYSTNFEANNAGEKKFTLFDSDSDNDICENDFKVQPQYKGEFGQYFLEMNSEMQGDFKIDDRFSTSQNKEKSSAEVEKKDNASAEDIEFDESTMGENKEKANNIKILESVVGCTIKRKEKTTKRMKIMRFDPDDESTKKYLKKTDAPKKLNRKRSHDGAVEMKEFDSSVSSERYVEVHSNLKEILSSSSTPFSFSSKFNFTAEQDNVESPFTGTKPHIIQTHESPVKKVKEAQQNSMEFSERRHYFFFIDNGHPYLKEGIEFWQTSKTIEEKNEEWREKKDKLQMMFRNKRQSFKRRFVKKVKASQRNKIYARNKNN